jgi:hypothetical protein
LAFEILKLMSDVLFIQKLTQYEICQVSMNTIEILKHNLADSSDKRHNSKFINVAGNEPERDLPE